MPGLSRVVGSRRMRTGELPRDSGPVSVASRRKWPPNRRSSRLESVLEGVDDGVGQEEPQVDRPAAAACSSSAGRRGWCGHRGSRGPTGGAPRRFDRRPGRRAARTAAGSGCPPAGGAAQLVRIDRDDQAAVGERRIVPALAHAVGAEVARVADAGHHVAARAHAEREQVAAAGPDRGTVVGRAQRRVAGVTAVPGLVDRRLRLLDPDAELERLGRDRHAAAKQHAVGVAGAVADRQDRHLGRDVSRRGPQTAEAAVGDIEILDEAGEPDLAAHLLELAPEGPDDQRQPIRAEVRPLLVDDRRLAVALGQDLEHPADVRPGPARGQLAVAERPRPALAEEVVALRVERAVLVESADVGDPVLDGAAPLEDQRSISGLGQQIAGDSPAGPEPMITGRCRSGRCPGRASRSGPGGTARRPAMPRRRTARRPARRAGPRPNS